MIKRYLVTALVFLVIDIVWLTVISPNSTAPIWAT